MLKNYIDLRYELQDMVLTHRQREWLEDLIERLMDAEDRLEKLETKLKQPFSIQFPE